MARNCLNRSNEQFGFARFLNYIGILVFITLLSACAPITIPQRREALPAKEISKIRTKLVTDAESFLGRKYIKVGARYFRSDCSGFVHAVYFKNKLEILDPDFEKHQNNVKNIYNYIQNNGQIYREGEPKPGDVVFFSHTLRKFGTYPLSHAGIVEKVDPDGTISFIHKSSFGIIRDFMNLKSPSTARNKEDHKILNSYMRKRRAGDTPKTRYLAGELFEAFGNVIDPGVMQPKEKVVEEPVKEQIPEKPKGSLKPEEKTQPVEEKTPGKAPQPEKMEEITLPDEKDTVQDTVIEENGGE